MCGTMPKFPKLEAKLAERGITYNQLAIYMGMSLSAISRRMNGEVEFDLAEINKILELLECSFTEVFGE